MSKIINSFIASALAIEVLYYTNKHTSISETTAEDTNYKTVKMDKFSTDENGSSPNNVTQSFEYNGKLKSLNKKLTKKNNIF